MPELCSFLSCERVIIDAETQQISLVSILQGINVPVPEVPPEGSVAQFAWAALTIWGFPLPGDGGIPDRRPFEQRVSFCAPDGVELLPPEVVPIPIPEPVNNVRPNGRIINRFLGFPIYRPGLCYLRLQIRESGAETWEDISKFYISVALNQSAPSQ